MATLGLAHPRPTSTSPDAQHRHRHRVYLRGSWSDPWTYVKYLTAISATRVPLPGRSRATLKFEYGRIKREDRTRYLNWNPQWVDRDLYVCITALPKRGVEYPVWTGIIPAHVLNVHGTQTGGSPPRTIPRGDQIMQAHGLEYLLDRRRVVGAYASGGNIGWQPTFNLRHGQGATLMGNRSEAKSGETFVFSGELAGSVPYRWSIRDIIEYILRWTEPTTAAEPTFVLSGLSYLNELYEVIRQEGKSVWTLLNELLDAKGGVEAYLEFGGAGVPNIPMPSGDIELRVSSMAGASATVGNYTFPANTDTVSITIDDEQGMKAKLATDSMKTYDRIIVRGQRTVSCFTVNLTEPLANYEIAWAGLDETAYGDLRNTPDGITADTKRQDTRWDRVYRMFRLGDLFGWTSAGAKLNPEYNGEGEIQLDQNAPFWNHDIRLLDWVPFPVAADIAAESLEPRQDKPAAYLLELYPPGDDLAGESTDRYHRSDAIGGSVHDAYPNLQQNIAFEVHARDGMFELKCDPGYILGRNWFDSETSDGGTDPVFDHTDMFCTIAVETDTPPVVDVPTGAPGGPTSRTLEVVVSDVQVWCVLGAVVTGVKEDGTLDYYTGQAVTRDDTDRLRAVAALLKAVYGKRRRSVEVTRVGLFDDYRLGKFLVGTGVHGAVYDINSVIVEQSWDFAAATTTFRTGHLNLDARKVF